MPKSRESFWREKFERNQMRDKENEKRLKSLGWKVHTIWECQTKDRERLDAILGSLFGGSSQNG